MDVKLDPMTAPYRDPRYAPRQLAVERRDDGSIVLTHPGGYFCGFTRMTDALAHWAERAPTRTWLAERSGAGWRTVAFAEAWERIGALAAGLESVGVLGDRPLLILSRNAVDHALIKYAVMGQGTPAAPVSPQYGLPGANLARLTHAAEVLRPAAVYVEDAVLFAEGLACEALAGLPVIAGANPRKGDIALADLYAHGSQAPRARPEDHAKYLLTSGSTGRPKAVICTHANTALNSAQIAACFADDEPPVMVNSAPWSHSLGANSILQQITHRGGTLYIDAGQPVAGRFDETIRNLKEISTTYHNMVPAGWMLLADALEADADLARTFFARVRILQYGGAALGQAFADRIQAVAVRTVGERITFASGYGATETGPTASNVHWLNDRMGLLGLPIPGTSVKLVPEGDKLEFRVKGPQVTQGYLGRPELSASLFDEEGYYRLGDAARLVDPDDPRQGLLFDGRLSENFKLASGTFVTAGELRIRAVSAIGGAVTDAVVCGENRQSVGLLLYPNLSMPPDAVAQAARRGLEALNAGAKGSGGRVGRALILPDGPDAAAGEITDKGYIAQPLARARRASAIERLFCEPPPAEVMIF